MLLLLLIATFATITLFSKNTVYSLVSLVAAFLTSGVLLIWLGFEFLGYVLIIVYVGAIAILFLFVVMTLDINKESSLSPHQKLSDFIPHLIALAFLVIVMKITHETVEPLMAPLNLGPTFMAWAAATYQSDDLTFLYFLLYLPGFPFLFVSGLLLLVAMMGSVFLTQSQRDVRKEPTVTRKPSQSTRVGRKY